MNIYLLAIIVVVVSYVVKSILSSLRSPLRLVPGPPGGLPIIGHTIDLGKNNAGELELDWAKKYGPVVSYGFLIYKVVLVTSPELVKHVIVTHDSNYSKKFFAYTNLAQQIGNGLVTMSDVDQHKHSRAMLTGAFTYQNLKRYFPIFVEKCDTMLSLWAQAPSSEQEQQRINLHEEVTACTLDIIGRAAFGVELDTMKPKQNLSSSELVGSRILNLLRGTFNDFQSPGLAQMLPFLRPYTKETKRSVKSSAALGNEMERIIEKKKTEQDQQQANQQEDEEDDRKRNVNDLLDVLVSERDEDGNGIPLDELIAQAKTFLIAGHETTATALCWAFIALAQNPDVEKKLVAEIIATLGPYSPSQKPLTPEVVESLKYLNKFTKELLRMYPPVSSTLRCVEEDDVLGGYTIPKGTLVVVSPYVMHHHPDLWDEPERFNPDRWEAGGRAENAPTGTYLPFWLGSRNCIGMKFAQLELKALLTKILQRYALRLPKDAPEYRRKFAVTMKPTPQPLFIVENRK